MKTNESSQLSLPNQYWFYLILLFSLGIRFFIFFDHYQTNPTSYISPSPTPNSENLYFQALTEHLWEYLWFSHTITPLNHFKDWFVFLLFPAGMKVLGNLIIVSFFNSVAAGLVYLTLRNFNLPKWLALSSAILVSIRLIGWDAWFMSGSWDLFNPFLLSLLAWSFSHYWIKKSLVRALIIGGAGFFLVSSLQTATVVAVPCIGLFTLLFSDSKRRVKTMCIALIPPLLLIGTLVVKNGVQHGVYAPTTGAGQNIIQNLNLALISPNYTGALELAEKLKYPNWWVWCYREAEKLDYFEQLNLGGFYGICNQTKKGFKFDSLKKYLADSDNPEILKIVEEDEIIIAEKPWLLAGQVNERGSKFSAIYGKISSRLLLDVATLYPRNFVGRTYLNFTYFIQNGPRFEMDYSHVADRLPNLVNNLSTYFAPILRAGMYLAYFLVLAIPCWFILKIMKFSTISGPTQLDGIIWILCVGFGFGTLANIAVHCCESYRHAFPFMPLIVIIMVHAGYRLVGEIWQKWHREADRKGA